MDISDPHTPIRSERGSEGVSPSTVSNDNRDSPVIPTEDSYFNNNSSSNPKPFRDLRQLGLILNDKRRAATQHIAIRGAGAAWIDRDTSGTYDPRLERATPPVTPPQRKRRSIRIPEENDVDFGGIPHPRPRILQRPVGYQNLITFSFTKERALAYLASIPGGPYDSEPGISDNDFSKSSAELEDNIFGPLLRTRKTRVTRSARKPNIATRKDGLTIDQLTLGHPQRRGCRACFEVGDDECSLIDNTHFYPCEACDDAGLDCEFILLPELKKSCERCKQKRISCSYRVDGGKGVDSCETCEEDEVKCLAGPLKSIPRAVRASIESSPPPAPSTKKRVFVSCNQCRNGSRRCSLKRDQPGPCRECRKSGEECAFVLIPVGTSEETLSTTPLLKTKKKQKKKRVKKQTRSGKEKTNDESDRVHTPGNRGGRNERTIGKESWKSGTKQRRSTGLRNEPARINERETQKQQLLRDKAERKYYSFSQTPEFKPGLGFTNRIPHIFIRTAFSHPISFNYISDMLNSIPCSWCTSPFFGLFGHGEVEVEVIPYPQVNGHGYEEIIGGHSNEPDRKPLSRMCVDCTTSRFTIMGCPKHKFVEVKDDPRCFIAGEMEKSVQALIMNDKEGGDLAEQAKWCSVCPSPAALKCCTRQTQDGSIGDGKEASGCGFYACEVCYDLFEKISKDSGNTTEALDRTICHASKDLFNYNYGVRADASFLMSKGELRVRLEKYFGEAPMLVEAEEEKSESSDGEDDSEAMSIYERVGEGRGEWWDKQKKAPACEGLLNGKEQSSNAQKKKQIRIPEVAKLSSPPNRTEQRQGEHQALEEKGLSSRGIKGGLERLGIIDYAVKNLGEVHLKTGYGDSPRFVNGDEGRSRKDKAPNQKLGEHIIISDVDED